MSMNTSYTVVGMTCGHCVSAVTEELAEIYGVSGVDVKLDPNGISTVVVTSDAPLDRAHVAAAIEEAGYALAPKP
jgi:copper chaperone CopZ